MAKMTSKTRLQLGRIMLQNYGLYRGKATIELSRDPEKTVTVIEGVNGGGKTTILNAVYWCLYGKFRSAGNPDDPNIINSDALSSLKPGDEDDTSVEIRLYEEDELRYAIKRSVHFVKKQESVHLVPCQDVDGKMPEGIEITPAVEFGHQSRLSGPDDWTVYTDPAQARDAILNIFPESLSSYFLVDAESLGSFFDAGNKSRVKDGIEKASELPTSEQRRHDLMGQLRSTVADKTTKYFLRLVPSGDFSKVEIDPDYAVTAHGSGGGRKSLGVGYTSCLALSYIAAIREIAEKNYFLMMDSPLHRIDHGTGIGIVKNLPEFFPGTQITLLVQDHEYVGRVTATDDSQEIPSVRDTLKDINIVWGEYKLQFSRTPAEAGSYATTVRKIPPDESR